MKLAYLILAHAHPEQLGRLVNRLSENEAQFYIHIDANTEPSVFSAMQSIAPQAQWAKRQACRWGGFSLVDASLRLMRMALAENCDWLILLSAQDYPIKRPQEIQQTLAQSQYAAYLDIQADFDVRYRWQAWHLESLNGRLIGKMLQKLQRAMNRCGIKRPSPLAEIKAGSQWWMMSADTARGLLDFLDARPDVLNFFKTTLVPDEMFFQTLLCHFIAPEKIAPSLRHIEWGEGSWSPQLLEAKDAARLIQGEALFARKFAPDGIATDAIDRLLS